MITIYLVYSLNFKYIFIPNPSIVQCVVFFLKSLLPCLVISIGNSSIQEVEARGSQVPGQPGLHKEILSKKKNLANVLNKRANELPSRYYSNESLFILLLK
jgi:hypothetical protein